MVSYTDKEYDSNGREWSLLSGLVSFFASLQAMGVICAISEINISPLYAKVILVLSLTTGLLAFILYGNKGKANSEVLEKKKPWRLWAMQALPFSVLAVLFCSSYGMPDMSWDGLTYHTPTIGFWMEKGYPHWIESESSAWHNWINETMNGYPKGVELADYIIIRAFDNQNLLTTINVVYMPLGAVAVFCISRLLGASRTISYFGATMYCIVPLSISHSFNTYVDSSFASCFGAACAFVCLSFLQLISREESLKSALYTGLGLGLATSAKVTGVIALPLALFIFFLAVVIRAFLSGGIQNKSGRHEWLKQFRLLVVLILSCYAVCGYWQARNYWHTANPVFPAEVSIGNLVLFEGKSGEEIVTVPYPAGTEGWSSIRLIFYTWIQGWSKWPSSIQSYTERTGGLGFLWILAGLPSSLILLAHGVRKKVGGCHGVVFVLGLMVAVPFFMMPYNHIARTTIFLYVLGLPAFAALISSLFKSKVPSFKVLGGTYLGLVIAVALLESGICYSFQMNRISQVISGRKAQIAKSEEAAFAADRQYPLRFVFHHGESEIIPQALKEEGNVAMTGLKGHRKRLLGILMQSPGLNSREIHFFDHGKALANPDYLKEFIRDHSIDYIIYDNSLIPPREIIRMSKRVEHVSTVGFVLEIDSAN